jgi:hypothetical protein
MNTLRLLVSLTVVGVVARANIYIMNSWKYQLLTKKILNFLNMHLELVMQSHVVLVVLFFMKSYFYYIFNSNFFLLLLILLIFFKFFSFD